MKKWEYKKWGASCFEFVEDIVEEEGKKGWELVLVRKKGLFKKEFITIFKRPLEEELNISE